jgi:hypothetical protein
VPNALRRFWVVDATGGRREIAARLRAQTAHAQMWVEEGAWHDINALNRAIQRFETEVYTISHATFGSEAVPGVDNDPHVLILHISDPDATLAAYTSGADLYPRNVLTISNQAELLVINLDAAPVGSAVYMGLLGEQFQRLIQWNQDPNEARWAKEALAELAFHLMAHTPISDTASSVVAAQRDALLAAYLREPATSLTFHNLPSAPGAARDARRGAALLFADYVHQRLGPSGIQSWAADPLNGTQGLDAVLARVEPDLTFEQLFSDWAVAVLAASNPDLIPADERFVDFESERWPNALTVTRYERFPILHEGGLQPYGIEYVHLAGDEDLSVSFQGITETALLPSLPAGEEFFWWSQRADASMTTLSRAVDLKSTTVATLTYQAWFDLEPGQDCALVECSIDGGATWHTLQASSSRQGSIEGNRQGWRYTGRSSRSKRWLDESVDLAPCVGAQALVRFTVLTDAAENGAGLALRRIALTADDDVTRSAGDDADNELQGWVPAGFVWTDNQVEQRYTLLLIGIAPDGAFSVEGIALDEGQKASWAIPLSSQEWQEAVIAIASLAQWTEQPASYGLRITPLAAD